jgi:multidrug resistance efflux pump
MPALIDENGELIIPPMYRQRSLEVNELLPDRPSFLIRWGMTILLCILVLMISASWFIRYPDTISANAKLTSINAPKRIISKISGKLTSLQVKEGDWVNAGSILGTIESVADPKEVISLSGDVDSINKTIDSENWAALKTFMHAKYSNLGEIQMDYQSFIQALLTFSNYIPGGLFVKKRGLLKDDRVRLLELNVQLRQQKAFSQQDLALEQKTLESQEALLKDKVISPLEYRMEKSKLLAKLQSLSPANAAIITNEYQQNDKQKEILELDNQINQQKMIFTEAVNTLKNQLQDWENIHLLIASVSGQVAFATFLQPAQQLQVNETVCYINPTNSSYFAQMYIPQANLGKIRIGAKVLLRFQAYPNQEYGSVEGLIDFMSKIPSDSGYLAKVSLPQGLNTNYNKQIQFLDGLTAHALIITKDRTLLQHFYSTLIQSVEAK